MIAKRGRALTWFAVLFLALAMLPFSGSLLRRNSAQAAGPILFSHPDSTRAIAIDSITSTREPFSTITPVAFSADRSTRLMLFAGNLRLHEGEEISVVTADAEDAAHHVFPLAVESVAAVPDQNWATAVIVKFNQDMANSGDVLVRIYYRGVPSNRVRIGIDHIGGGPPDDFGAVPTPGPLGVNFPINPVTAGTLTIDEVKTIIAQAVSAAASINKPVTVAVTDREGNVLGLFAMTGAPSMM